MGGKNITKTIPTKIILFFLLILFRRGTSLVMKQDILDYRAICKVQGISGSDPDVLCVQEAVTHCIQ